MKTVATVPPACASSSAHDSFASGSPMPVSTSVQPSSPGSKYACTCPGLVGSGSVTRRIPSPSSSIASTLGGGSALPEEHCDAHPDHEDEEAEEPDHRDAFDDARHGREQAEPAGDRGGAQAQPAEPTRYRTRRQDRHRE